MLFTEISRKPQVRTTFHEGNVGRNPFRVRTMVLTNDRAYRGKPISFGIDSGSGRSVPRLHHQIGFMVAASTIDRSDECEAVKHLCLFRQVLTDRHARDTRLRNAERSPVLVRPIGFWIPCVDMAWASSHPKQNDTFSVAVCRFGVSSLEQTGKCQTGQTRHARLEHASSIHDR